MRVRARERELGRDGGGAVVRERRDRVCDRRGDGGAVPRRRAFAAELGHAVERPREGEGVEERLVRALALEGAHRVRRVSYEHDARRARVGGGVGVADGVGHDVRRVRRREEVAHERRPGRRRAPGGGDDGRAGSLRRRARFGLVGLAPGALPHDARRRAGSTLARPVRRRRLVAVEGHGVDAGPFAVDDLPRGAAQLRRRGRRGRQAERDDVAEVGRFSLRRGQGPHGAVDAVGADDDVEGAAVARLEAERAPLPEP